MDCNPGSRDDEWRGGVPALRDQDKDEYPAKETQGNSQKGGKKIKWMWYHRAKGRVNQGRGPMFSSDKCYQ